MSSLRKGIKAESDQKNITHLGDNLFFCNFLKSFM